VIRLARSHQAEQIIMAADVSRYARQRYQRLAAACQQHRLALREAGSLSVVPPGAIVPSGGDHYRVFTPYWRAWSAYHWRQPLPAPKHVPVPPGADAGALPAPKDLLRGPLAALVPRGGETAARGRMARWLEAGLAGYPGRHDDLAAAATSRLSADLHFGTISPLELALAATGTAGGDAYVRQLCWRDFYLQVTAAFPDIATRDYRPRRGDWRDDPQAYQAWCAGQTGIPIVDAGMRQRAVRGVWLARGVLAAGRAGGRRAGRAGRGLEPVNLGLQPAGLFLEFQDTADAGEVQPIGGQGHDLVQPADVVGAVAAGPAGAARRVQQPLALVDAQRLRVQAGQLGGHRDAEQPAPRLGPRRDHHGHPHTCPGRTPRMTTGSLNPAAAPRPRRLAAGAVAGGSIWTGPAQISGPGGGPKSTGGPRQRDAGPGRRGWGGGWPPGCLDRWPRS
jgi:hypothetical protein